MKWHFVAPFLFCLLSVGSNENVDGEKKNNAISTWAKGNRDKLFTMGKQTNTDDATPLSPPPASSDETEKAADVQDRYQNRLSLNEFSREHIRDLKDEDFEVGVAIIRDQLVNDSPFIPPPTSRLDPQSSERHLRLKLPADLPKLVTINAAADRMGGEDESAHSLTPQRKSHQDAANRKMKPRNNVLVKTNRIFRQRFNLKSRFRDRKIPDNILSHISEFRRPPFKTSNGKNWYVDQITRQVQKILINENKRSRRRPHLKRTKVLEDY